MEQLQKELKTIQETRFAFPGLRGTKEADLQKLEKQLQAVEVKMEVMSRVFGVTTTPYPNPSRDIPDKQIAATPADLFASANPCTKALNSWLVAKNEIDREIASKSMQNSPPTRAPETGADSPKNSIRFS